MLSFNAVLHSFAAPLCGAGITTEMKNPGVFRKNAVFGFIIPMKRRRRPSEIFAWSTSHA